jgi:hypothetical protein
MRAKEGRDVVFQHQFYYVVVITTMARSTTRTGRRGRLLKAFLKNMLGAVDALGNLGLFIFEGVHQAFFHEELNNNSIAQSLRFSNAMSATT